MSEPYSERAILPVVFMEKNGSIKFRYIVTLK